MDDQMVDRMVYTAEDIQKRVLEIEHKLLPEVVGLYCDNKIKIIDGKAKVI